MVKYQSIDNERWSSITSITSLIATFLFYHEIYTSYAVILSMYPSLVDFGYQCYKKQLRPSLSTFLKTISLLASTVQRIRTLS